MNEENTHMDTENLDEDDPIVKEIPTFLSKRLQEQLYMFQFPLIPIYRTPSMDVRKCSVKPQNQSIKLEVQMNTASPYFDHEKAEQIANRIDGPSRDRTNNKEVYFENGILDKISYVSSKAVDDTGNYAIGVYNGRQLHIMPLKGILCLKPYHAHLDIETKKNQDPKLKEQSEKEKQVTVTLSSDTDKSEEIQKTDYEKLMEKDAAESCINCDWHPEGSNMSNMALNSLI